MDFEMCRPDGRKNEMTMSMARRIPIPNKIRLIVFIKEGFRFLNDFPKIRI
jgi:hypothetical protein